MVQIEYLPIVLTGIGIIVSILYYTSVLRNQNKTRQTQLFLQFYNRLTDKQFFTEFKNTLDQEWTDFDDYLEKYGYGPTLFDIYLEGVGLLVKRNQIDISLVDDLMSSLVITYWRSHGAVMLEMRKRRKMPQIAEWTEYLYNEIMKVSEKQHSELAT
jgi:hypothetical protein